MKLKIIIIILVIFLGIEGLIIGNLLMEKYQKEIIQSEQEPIGIYNTEINTVCCSLLPDGGATQTYLGIKLDAINEMVAGGFFLGSNVDTLRSILLTIVFRREDNNGDSITMLDYVWDMATDGSANSETFINENTNWNACGQYKYQKRQINLPDSKLHKNWEIYFKFSMQEANRSISILSISIRYYIHRT